jgi:hypothetical protein
VQAFKLKCNFINNSTYFLGYSSVNYLTMSVYTLSSEIVCSECHVKDNRFDCTMATDKCVCEVGKKCKCCRICKYICIDGISVDHCAYRYYYGLCRHYRPQPGTRTQMDTERAVNKWKGKSCVKCKKFVLFTYFYHMHNSPGGSFEIDSGSSSESEYESESEAVSDCSCSPPLPYSYSYNYKCQDQYPESVLYSTILNNLHKRVIKICQANTRRSVSERVSERRESLALKLGRLLTPAEVNELWEHYLRTEN